MYNSFGASLPTLPAVSSAVLPVIQSPQGPHDTRLEKPVPTDFRYLPSILDLRIHEWIAKLTSPVGGVFPNGISPKQMEALAHSQWAAALRAGREFRPAWRGSNHLSALLSNEVRAGRLIRVQKACYIGCDPATLKQMANQKRNEHGNRMKRFIICSICRRNIEDKMSSCRSLTCKTCRIHVHPECAYNQRRIPTKLVHGNKEWRDSWQCVNCKRCNVCNGAGKQEALFCENCDSMEHMRCQRKADIDYTFWHCSICVKPVQTTDLSPIQTLANMTANMTPVVTSIPTPDSSHNGSPTLEHGNLPTDRFPFPSRRIHPDPTESPIDVDIIRVSTETPSVGFPSEVSTQRTSNESVSEEMSEMIESTDSNENKPEHNWVQMAYVKTWSADQVVEYFQALGQIESALALKNEEVDGPALLLIEKEDVLCRLGLKVGPALKTYKVIKRLQKAVNALKKQKKKLQ